MDKHPPPRPSPEPGAVGAEGHTGRWEGVWPVSVKLALPERLSRSRALGLFGLHGVRAHVLTDPHRQSQAGNQR